MDTLPTTSPNTTVLDDGSRAPTSCAEGWRVPPASPASPSEHHNIPGLYTWSANPIQMASVAAELHTAFDTLKRSPDAGSRHGRRRMSDAIELGISFNRMEKDEPVFCMERATGSKNFSSTLSLIAEQTAMYRDEIEKLTGTTTSPSNDHHLNVVIRRYRPGQSIGFHIDRPEKFEDAVWNVVVETTDPAGGLQYEVEKGVKVPVMEAPGMVSVQTGAARHTFKHGVPTVSSERVSITWRWFRPTFLTTLVDYNEAEARSVLAPFVNIVQRSSATSSSKSRAGSFTSASTAKTDSETDSECGSERTLSQSSSGASPTLSAASPTLPPAGCPPSLDWSMFGTGDVTSSSSSSSSSSLTSSAAAWHPAGFDGSPKSTSAPTSPSRSPSGSSRVRARPEAQGAVSWDSRPRVGIISGSMGGIGQASSTGGTDHVTRFCRALGHALSRASRHAPALKNLALCLAEPSFALAEAHDRSPTSSSSSSSSLPAVDARSRAVGGAFRDGNRAPTRVVRGGASSMGGGSAEATTTGTGAASVHILPTVADAASDETFTTAANVYLLVEGGFSAADMARTLMANPNATLIHIGCTGGAAAGYFDVAPERPANVPAATWDILQTTPLSDASTDDQLRRVAASAASAVLAVVENELAQKQSEAALKQLIELDLDLNLDVDVGTSATLLPRGGKAAKQVDMGMGAAPMRMGRSRAVTTGMSRGTAWPRGAMHRSNSNSRSPSLTHYASSSANESAAPASCW